MQIIPYKFVDNNDHVLSWIPTSWTAYSAYCMVWNNVLSKVRFHEINWW